MRTTHWRLKYLLAGALLAGCAYAHGPEPGPCNDPTPVTYRAVVAPIIATHCLECHGGTVYTTLGGNIDFSTYRGLHNQSGPYLLSSVRHEPGAPPMPRGRDKLSDCDIARLQAWVDAGEPDN